jgi:hypothetical protein
MGPCVSINFFDHFIEYSTVRLSWVSKPLQNNSYKQIKEGQSYQNYKSDKEESGLELVSTPYGFFTIIYKVLISRVRDAGIIDGPISAKSCMDQVPIFTCRDPK